MYGRGIAAFYIANRNVATTHLNNQSGTIATVQNLNLKKKKKKENEKKDSINQMCTVGALLLFI